MFRRTCLGIAVLGALGIKTTAQVLFVVNSDGTVGEYDATTGTAINPALITGLSYPTAIAVSGTDIFVGCQGAYLADGYVSEYTTTGQLVASQLQTFGKYAVSDLTVSGADLYVGTVYYAGTFQIGEIGEYTIDGKVVNSTINDDVAFGIAVSGSNLFISHYGTTSTGSIDEETNAGTPVASVAENLAEPQALAVSGSDVFVVDNGMILEGGGVSGGIVEFSTSGGGVPVGGVSDHPNALAIWGDDLFAANSDGTISEYSTSLQLFDADFITGLDNPQGIAVVLPEPEGFCIFWMFVLLGSARRRQRHRTKTYAVLRD